MSSTIRDPLRRHGVPFGVFGVIGAVVFLFGSLILYVEVSLLGMTTGWAYLVQGFVSVETSFLLNWRITWRGRHAGFWSALWRFNLLKAVTIPVNQAVFMLLVAAGVHYLVANVVTVAVFTFVNYVACSVWAFRLSRATVRSTPSPQ